jgi:hypothetical protein
MHGSRDFKSRVLPINFEGGHQEYKDKWHFMFMYETYNILVNSRRTNSKEEEHAAEQNKLRGFQTKTKHYSWPGYVVCGVKDEFQTVRLYDEPPHAGIDAIAMKDKTKSNDRFAFSLRQIREDDLIIISETKIDLKGKDDIKQVGDVNFLLHALSRPGTMCAFVKEKWFKGNGFVTLIVDNSKSKYLEQLEMADSFAFMHCYHFESLATTIREYRTLKMTEFCKMAPIIQQPTLSIKKKQEMVAEHQKTLHEAINADVKPVAPTRSWGSGKAEKPIDIPANLRQYMKNNAGLFNPSQAEVLQKVVEMPENDILLIQGPPGTGKTHTVTGIISMLISSGVKKILICAPSNAAIDEIISRVSERGWIGTNLREMPKIEEALLRIGSMEYEPSKIVRQHTLDERLMIALNGAKIYTLREHIEVGAAILKEMKAADFPGLSMENKSHVAAIQKLQFDSYRKIKDWLKKKTLEQQIEIFERQLERNQKKLCDMVNGDEGSKQGGDW